jgi:hypothetical protein
MTHGISSCPFRQSAVELQRQRLLRQSGLPFAELLAGERVAQALPAKTARGWRERLYTPLVTLQVFLSQILDPDHSCRQAVARFLAWLVGQGQPACSEQTGAYCKARQRLPETALSQLTRQTGADLDEHTPRPWRWHGRKVRLADGSTLSMPDTPANQARYPQARTQKPGVGFPILRIVVLFSLAVGTVLNAALCPYKGKETGETALLWQLLDGLKPGDVLVGDRCYASYWLIAKAQQQGIDVIFRQHQCRQVDFRTGRRLGRQDHVIIWKKPKRPTWMDAATWAGLPATLTLRELRVRVPKGKARTREITVVTTLLDASRYARSEIAAVYRRRWEAEIHLRALKQTLQMDILRGKTPDLVGKELWAHLLVNNLLRTLLARAAEAHSLQPWQISFKGTLQTLNAFTATLHVLIGPDPLASYQALLAAIAAHRVGDRPDRYEPRKLKRRPKPHDLLLRPRQEEKKLFAQGRGGC